jgi:hypothetical protein
MPTSYTLTNDAGGRFEIVGNSLRTLTSLAAQAGTHIITVRAANLGGAITRDFSVIVEADGSIGRITQITTSPQGRPNVTPAAFFEGGQAEIDNPNEHPMITGVTHTSIRSGNFSDPTMWSIGSVPGAGSVWRIAAPHVVTYDMERDVIMKDGTVAMGATLRWATDRDTRIRLDFFMAMGRVDLRDGAESSTPGKARHEIVFHATEAPLATARLGFMPMGPCRIRGAKKTAHLRVGLTGVQTVPAVAAGATTIRLTGLATAAWRVGDTIVILGTEYLSTVSSDPQYSGPTGYYNSASFTGGSRQRNLNNYQFGQDEQRTITAISGDTITLSAALTFAHTGITGTLPSGKVVTKAPVVMNMSRSIRFRTASAAEDSALDAGADLGNLQKRAHLMFMRHPDVDTRYFEVKNMGRSSNDPSLFVAGLPDENVGPLTATLGGPEIANPINVTGRWALHYHWCGGPYANAPQVNCIGASIWAPIGEYPIPGWAVAHHGCRMAIEDCNVSNFRGAGIVSEQGNEIGQWVNNCVTGGRGDGDSDYWGSRAEFWNKHHGAIGVAYENQSRAVLLHDNIAGSSRVAFQWHASKALIQTRSPRDVDMRLTDGMSQTPVRERFDGDFYGAVNAQIPPFINNEAWASRFGVQVIHRQGHGRHRDKTPMLMEDFHCVNVVSPFHVPEYSNSYYAKDCLWQGPIGQMGSSTGATLGSVTWDWNFANMHLRNYGVGFSDGGAGLNYEGHIIDVTYENVTSLQAAPWRVVDGAHPARDVMGPWTPHSTIAGQWRVRDYLSESSANLPSPYPLEPYGRKLPAGFPAVNPGDTPYFLLGNGVDGAATPSLSLTLQGGQGRVQGMLFGIIRDSVGDRRYPDWQSSENFPGNLGIKTGRTLEKAQPEQLVQRNGCWFDGTAWRMRTHHFGADRFTHVRFVFHVDWTLTGFNAGFLAGHDIGGPPVAPTWPDLLEVVPTVQPGFIPIVKTMRFLSRSRLEVIEGQTLTHRLRPNDVYPMLSIVGGADQALFRISSNQLQWAAGGTRPRNASDANGDNVYEVRVRAADQHGNFVETDHFVSVVSSARVVTEIVDTFDRANENLVANPAYLLLQGAADGLRVANNRVENFNTTNPRTIVSLGSLGTSDQQITFSFPASDAGSLLFRMFDATNWLQLRRTDSGGNALRLEMMVNGVFSEVARFKNAAGGTWRMKVVSDRFEIAILSTDNNGHSRNYPLSYGSGQMLDYDPFTSPGVILLPSNAPLGCEVGIRSGQWVGGGIDTLTAVRAT